MRTASVILIVLLLVAALPLAAVDGVVLNRTTGDPASETIVSLFRVGTGGMEPVGSAMTDASGSFQIDASIQGPHLLQAIFEGATYNTMLTPGSPTTGLEVDVYDASAAPDTAHLSEHMILIEPLSGILHVSEIVILHNDGNVTYNDPENGTLRLYLPPDIQNEPQASVSGPQGVPVDRPLIETSIENVYMVDFPVKPGETRFDLTYILAEPEDSIFRGRILEGGEPARLVVPGTVSLSGDGITELGQDSTTGAIVYEAPVGDFAVTVTGTGQLSRSDSSQPAASGGSDLAPIAARIYDSAYAVVGLALLILLAGFLYLYRRSSA